MLKKRKFPRVDGSWHLKFRVVDKQTVQGSPLESMALNVSGGGVCFTTKDTVEPGTLLALEMQSPGFDIPVIAMAKAVWCKKRHFDDMFDLGCEFWWVGWKDKSAQEALADYIQQQTTTSGSEAQTVED